MQPHKKRLKRRRRGVMLAVELVMVLPVLLIVLLAFVEFGILLMASQGVGASASLAAREAALASSTEASLVGAAEGALEGWVWKGKHEVVIFVNGAKVDLNDANDDLQSAATAAEISVTINVPMTQAAPDLLRYFGLSLAGKDLTATYVTRKE